MHDIWNPWHGCIKVSEGCRHCYMYFLDKIRAKHGDNIYRTQAFNYPLQRNRNGNYIIKSGELIRVCMTSDFFLSQADQWRYEAWEIIRQRPDVKFFLLTKRPERVVSCLPENWGDGWDNVMINVSCENQSRADERLPILLDLPFKHKGFMAAPLIGPLDIERYLSHGTIEQVIAGGENYDGARPCHYEWVRSLSAQCEKHLVSFCFIETGTNFVKDGKTYYMPNKRLQSKMAFKANINVTGKPIHFTLKDPLGFPLENEYIKQPHYKESCVTCGSRPICNGCSECGKCR